MMESPHARCGEHLHARQRPPRPPLLLPHRLPPLSPSRSRQRLALVSGCWARHDACHRASKLTKLTKLTKPPSPLRVPLPPLAHLRRPIRAMESVQLTKLTKLTKLIRALEPVKLTKPTKLIRAMESVKMVAEAVQPTRVRPRATRRLGRHPRR